MKSVNKNLPNNLTKLRIVLSIIIIVLMLFPFDMVNINFPKWLIDGNVVLDLKLLIVAFLFIIASLTDYFDGKIARKYNLVSDYGKVMDAIADKILVNGLLIILCGQGYISPIIPVIIITRDTFVDSIKMVAGQKGGKAVGASIWGKAKTVCMMTGVSFMLLYNLPFELLGINVSLALIVIATILSIVSGIQYFMSYKEALTKEM